MLSPSVRHSPWAPFKRSRTPDPYITCFYQFDRAPSKPSAPQQMPSPMAPTSPISSPLASASAAKAPAADLAPRWSTPAEKASNTSPCLDVHKYHRLDEQPPTCPAKTMGQKEFTGNPAHLGSGGADAWGFNEMPTTGPKTPHLRETVARWIRMIHRPRRQPKISLRLLFHRTKHPARSMGGKFATISGPRTG